MSDKNARNRMKYSGFRYFVTAIYRIDLQSVVFNFFKISDETGFDVMVSI